VIPAGDPPARVLVVCSANRCRSPLAAALLRMALVERDVPADVGTAGLRSPGRSATDQTSMVGARRGLDLTAHRSRTLDPDLIATTDLILGMERVHVREVVALEPSAWSRTFTLKELVRRGESAGSREPDESIGSWLRRVSEGRTARDLMGESPDDDVTDPTGGPMAEHEDLAQELEDLVRRLAELVAVPVELPPVRWQSP
jgi:protein-tyrosine-phosphatase